jgi:hypothetical protein
MDGVDGQLRWHSDTCSSAVTCTGRWRRGERQRKGVGAVAEGSECGGAMTWGKVAARRPHRRGIGWRPGVEGDGELAPGEAGGGGVQTGPSDRCDNDILCGERDSVRAVAASEKNRCGGSYPRGRRRDRIAGWRWCPDEGARRGKRRPTGGTLW